MLFYYILWLAVNTHDRVVNQRNYWRVIYFSLTWNSYQLTRGHFTKVSRIAIYDCCILRNPVTVTNCVSLRCHYLYHISHTATVSWKISWFLTVVSCDSFVKRPRFVRNSFKALCGETPQPTFVRIGVQLIRAYNEIHYRVSKDFLLIDLAKIFFHEISWLLIHLNGKVIGHNCVIWYYDKPQLHEEILLKSKGLAMYFMTRSSDLTF